MAVMEKFETYFGFQLAYLILRHTDDIAKSLQKSGLSAAEGSTLVMNALEGLKEESNNFDQFWEKVNENARKENKKKMKISFDVHFDNIVIDNLYLVQFTISLRFFSR